VKFRVALVLAVGTVLSGCSPPGSAARPSATATAVTAPKPDTTQFVRLLDSRRFDPARLSGRAGELVELVLVGGDQKHDFTSPGLNVNIDVLPHRVEVIQVRLPAAGTYDFWSGQPGDRDGGMAGQFVVDATTAPS